YYSQTLFVGGEFLHLGVSPRPHLAQISTVTGLVTTFAPSVNGIVNALEVSFRSSGAGYFDLVAGGSFSLVDKQTRSNLVAIRVDGTLEGWNPNPNGAVYTVVEHNVVYVGGAFTSIGGAARNRAAAIDPLTPAVTSWNPNANNTVESIAWYSTD